MRTEPSASPGRLAAGAGVKVMIRRIVLGGMLATAALLASAGQDDAFACNRTAGCAMDVFLEDYAMKHDGRMDEAIKAGQANVEAFRAYQEAEKAYAARKH